MNARIYNPAKCETPSNVNRNNDVINIECGSTATVIKVHSSSMITVSSDINVIVNVAKEFNFMLKTIISSNEKTSEGRIIEAVSLPWFEIINLIKNDPSVTLTIPPDKWEEIIAGAYKKAGFDEVILTPRSGDYGRDVIATKKGLGQVRVIDQVKAYKPGHHVTANDVRALIGVLASDGASKGFLTTTSDFAPKLREDPFIIPHIPARLELINGETLFKRLGELTV